MINSDTNINLITFDFASRIIKFYKFLTDQKKEFVISKQLLRSDTSIGANLREAKYAESDLDFIHKVSISLKEAAETEYWIDLLFENEFINDKEYTSLKEDVVSILKILTSIKKTKLKNTNIKKQA